MELHIDLLQKNKKHWFSIIWGIAAFLVTAAWFSDRMIENLEISTFDWIYKIFTVLFGAWLLFTGLGHHVRKLFGSAYIRIDDSLIAVKNGIRAKEESVSWKEIKTMEFKSNQFRITREDGTALLLKLPYTNSLVSNEAIHAIVKSAREKGIDFNLSRPQV